MKMKFLFLMMLTSISSAFANCGYQLNTPTFTYGMGDTNPSTPGTITLKRTKNTAVCANFFLAFTKGWAGNYNRVVQNLAYGDSMYYNLYKNANSTGVLKEPNDISSVNEVIYGTIANNETKTLNYNFTLGATVGTLPPRSGTYIDVVQVQAYSGTYTNINAYEGYRDLYIYVNVVRFVSLSLVDTGGAYDAMKTTKTLDFGELEENEELSFDVRVVANSGYNLKVSSANNGILKRTDGTGTKSEIAYDFYGNGTKRTLSSSASTPVSIASASGRTPAGGAAIPVKVVIKSVTDKDPGTYQDYITLSIIGTD